MKRNAVITDILKKHPLLTYVALTFIISWGGVLLVIGGPGKIHGAKEQFDILLPIVILVLLAGPSISGILLTALVYGKTGLDGYRSRLLRWRVNIRWYAISLLTAPVLMTAVYLLLWQLSPKFLPGIFTVEDKVNHLLMGIMTGLIAGIVEELGWTGFATPLLRKRYRVLTTGLVVGLLWAVWHILPAFWLGLTSDTINGTLSVVSYLIDPFLFLIAFRILIVWVYDRTESLFIGILMHISLTSSARIITPIGIVGKPLMLFDITWAVVVWTIIIAVIVAKRRRLSKQP